MKYIVNILLFLIMIYSLTVMPIDMKALQVDVSWEKYKSIEEKKENQEQQAEIAETVKTSTYHLAYSGQSYIHNPSELSFTIEGDQKLQELQEDVLKNLTFEWVNKLTGDKQILSVPQTAVKTGSISGAETMSLPVTVSLSGLSQIPDGQYTLKVNSQSELTANSEAIGIELSWFKTSKYTSPATVSFGKSTAVTYYYPASDNTSLIPITEAVSNEKVLRKMANHMLAGPGTVNGLRQGQMAPRIRNIQLKSGKLSLYMNKADVETAVSSGISAETMSSAISRTYFSLPYIEEIYFYIDNKPVSVNWTEIPEAAAITKPAATPVLYRLASFGTSLYYVPTAQTFTSPDQLFNLMTSPDSSQMGKTSLQVIPANVTLSASQDPEDSKHLIVNVSLEGDLYGKDESLTRMLLDHIALNLVSGGLAESVSFSVNGQAGQILNGVDLTNPYEIPKYLNTKKAAS